MYGFLEDYELIIECAKRLQDHIEAVCDERGVLWEIPQVIVSFSQVMASIAVEELQIWHCEVDTDELTPELLIAAFTQRCNQWAEFSCTDKGRCPRCNSPDPKKHPAVQYEGEVQLCSHPWHRTGSFTELAKRVEELEQHLATTIEMKTK